MVISLCFTETPTTATSTEQTTTGKEIM